MAVDPTHTHAVQRVILETRLLFRELRGVADQVHDEVESAARRSLLFELAADGAQTVPALAEARNVSRQAVQVLVDALAADGLVERLPNPAHKRSWLWRATEAGAERVRLMRARERAFLEQLDGLPDATELNAASQVLASFREALARSAHAEE